MTNFPVPARLPWFIRRARFALVPGLSDPYQERICFTRSVSGIGEAPFFEAPRVLPLLGEAIPRDVVFSPTPGACLQVYRVTQTCVTPTALVRLGPQGQNPRTMAESFPSVRTTQPPAVVGTTLREHVLHGMHAAPGATGEFTSLLNHISLAIRIINSRVRAAGLAGLLGYTGETNVQG